MTIEVNAEIPATTRTALRIVAAIVVDLRDRGGCLSDAWAKLDNQARVELLERWRHHVERQLGGDVTATEHDAGQTLSGSG